MSKGRETADARVAVSLAHLEACRIHLPQTCDKNACRPRCGVNEKRVRRRVKR